MRAGLWQWLRLPGWPAVPRLLWLTLGSLGFCWLNSLFEKEIWPHVPQVELAFSVGAWLLLLSVLPQLLGVAWRWLRSWQGPALLRWLATAMFLAWASLSAMGWLVFVLDGLGVVRWGRGHGLLM